jgi:hypothetical protein
MKRKKRWELLQSFVNIIARRSEQIECYSFNVRELNDSFIIDECVDFGDDFFLIDRIQLRFSSSIIGDEMRRWTIEMDPFLVHALQST